MFLSLGEGQVNEALTAVERIATAEAEQDASDLQATSNDSNMSSTIGMGIF